MCHYFFENNFNFICLQETGLLTPAAAIPEECRQYLQKEDLHPSGRLITLFFNFPMCKFGISSAYPPQGTQAYANRTRQRKVGLELCESILDFQKYVDHYVVGGDSNESYQDERFPRVKLPLPTFLPVVSGPLGLVDVSRQDISTSSSTYFYTTGQEARKRNLDRIFCSQDMFHYTSSYLVDFCVPCNSPYWKNPFSFHIWDLLVPI